MQEHLAIAEKKSQILQEINFSEYAIVTIHRAENVDNPKILGDIVEALIVSKVPIVISLHPRTKNRLMDFGYLDKIESAANIQIIPPQGYLDFLVLMKNSRFVVTDSGGIQEEVTSPSLSKRVLVLRRSTERPEAIQAGMAKLVPLELKQIIMEVSSEWNALTKSFPPSPYGDGLASDKILDILRNSSFASTDRSPCNQAIL